jgi:pimeloyl-ACP methyl ester carboxylesterase
MSTDQGYLVTKEIVDGIERITYTPHAPKSDTEILFLHGMWHGAWCWQQWQEILAENGWKSRAISLPGHGNSEKKGSTRFATMGVYLKVLKSEVESFAKPPILIGHSMGGALGQWYLKKVADDLPAMVLIASWTSHSTWADGMLAHLMRDPWGTTLVGLTLSTSPFIRDPEHAASMLITDEALYSPKELHAKLDHESALVLNQHNPPLWSPKRNPKTPLLWIAAENDAVVSHAGAKKSAAFYGAEFVSVSDTGHNMMMETSFRETAMTIDAWLARKLLGVT